MEVKTCPNCNKTIDRQQAYCTFCGAAQPVLTACCAGCGAPLKSGSTFCGSCGAPAGAAAPPKSGGAVSKPLLIVLMVIGAAVLFALVYILTLKLSSPGQKAQQGLSDDQEYAPEQYTPNQWAGNQPDYQTPEYEPQPDYQQYSTTGGCIYSGGYYASEHQLNSGCSEELIFDGDYIFPDSDSRYLTREEISLLGPHECLIALNEIFARYGRRFNLARIQDYFDTKQWYYGYWEPEEVSYANLNAYEQQNVLAIQSWQKDCGYELE